MLQTIYIKNIKGFLLFIQITHHHKPTRHGKTILLARFSSRFFLHLSIECYYLSKLPHYIFNHNKKLKQSFQKIRGVAICALVRKCKSTAR